MEFHWSLPHRLVRSGVLAWSWRGSPDFGLFGHPLPLSPPHLTVSFSPQLCVEARSRMISGGCIRFRVSATFSYHAFHFQHTFDRRHLPSQRWSSAKNHL